MKSGVRAGGLILSLAGWVSGLGAQEIVWRPAGTAPPAQPTPVQLAPEELRPCPTASLGRPEPYPDDTAGSQPPPYLLPGSSSGIVLAGYQSPAPRRPSFSPRAYAPEEEGTAPAARGGPSPEIIAASPPAPPPDTPPAAEGEEAEPPSLFAVDRLLTPAPVLPPPTGVVQTGWVPPTWSPARPEPEPVPEAAPDAFAPPSPNPYLGRFYASAEYLLWWVKGEQVPPLVTTSSPADMGFLGRPTTQVLFGNSTINDSLRSGLRLRVGYWLDGCNKLGIELGGFFLGTQQNHFEANSAMFPVLARPFFNLNNNIEFAQLVAFPGVSTGNVSVNSRSNLWGAQANLLCSLCCGCNYWVNALGGFRYLGLYENLSVTENIQGLPTAAPPFTNALVVVNDRFATLNQFYGAQVGLGGYYFWNRWSVGGRVSVALGDTHEVLDISGSERLTSAGGVTTTSTGGLLALPSNIGHYNLDRFSVVPEVGFNIGYQVTPHLRAFVGYNFLYWSNVLRPGQQIDRVLDVTQIPNFAIAGAVPTGQNRPMVPFHQSDIWAQGISFGIQFIY